ncbi:hypothetical protein D3C80_1827510 [compost metagenome]
MPLPRLALAVMPMEAPPWPTEMATPTPALELLLLRSVSTVFLAASKAMSPSALRWALPPALTSLPRTVMSESCPAPVALMRTSPPAATVEPAARSLAVLDLLSLLLLPPVMEMLRPPAAFGSPDTAS